METDSKFINSNLGPIKTLESGTIPASGTKDFTIQGRRAYLVFTTGQSTVTQNMWFVSTNGTGTAVVEIVKSSNVTLAFGSDKYTFTITNTHTVQPIAYSVIQVTNQG